MYYRATKSLKNEFRLVFRQSTTAAFRRARHSLCSVAATGIPGLAIPEYARGQMEGKLESNSKIIMEDNNNTSSTSASQSHRRGASKYIPYAQKFIEGISALDQNETWSLVQELALEGHLPSTRCPDFIEFEHIVQLGDFSLALSALLWTKHYSLPRDSQQIESLGSEVEGASPVEGLPGSPDRHLSSLDIPTWLSAYMLATMVNTRVNAARSFEFCLSLLDTTSKSMAVSLLLLSMCSLVRFNVLNQVPGLLAAFSDILLNHFHSPSEANGSVTTASLASTYPDYSLPLIVFQCNILLTLLSQLPQSVILSKSAVRFLRHMQEYSVTLETDTAKKLLDANFATQEMAYLVTEMLQSQRGLLTGAESPDIYISLARFYTKRRDLTGASKVMAETKNYHVHKHLSTYLRAFQDTAYALKYIKETNTVSDGNLTQGKGKDVLDRPVYVSLLRSAAQCRTVSTESFLAMFETIRDQFDNDRRLYTIALIGLIRRRDFEQARVLWNEWVAGVDQLGTIVNQLRNYLSKRQENYEDAQEVRKALDWDKRTELLAKRKLRRLQIDSDALVLGIRAISGPKPDSLITAFLLIEKYSQKNASLITSRVVNSFMNRALYFRRPDLAFKLWDGMKTNYGVDPSLGSLIILLRASRISASMNSSMQHYVPKWFKRQSWTLPLDASFNEQIKLMLHPAYKPDVSWYNWEPWRIARHIFRERLVFGNWPKLRAVKTPALAIQGDSATSSIDAVQEAELHRQMIGLDLGVYYHLLPDQHTFKQYVLMLGRVQRSSEIPEVLAWMKALNVVPTKLTLSVFLALWSQVGLGSPIDEGWRMFTGNNIGHGGEYGRLINWLEVWLGQENIPADDEILEGFKYIDSIESKESVLY